jgi:hypothetical protein
VKSIEFQEMDRQDGRSEWTDVMSIMKCSY